MKSLAILSLVLLLWACGKQNSIDTQKDDEAFAYEKLLSKTPLCPSEQLNKSINILSTDFSKIATCLENGLLAFDRHVVRKSSHTILKKDLVKFIVQTYDQDSSTVTEKLNPLFEINGLLFSGDNEQIDKNHIRPLFELMRALNEGAINLNNTLDRIGQEEIDATKVATEIEQALDGPSKRIKSIIINVSTIIHSQRRIDLPSLLQRVAAQENMPSQGRKLIQQAPGFILGTKKLLLGGNREQLRYNEILNLIDITPKLIAISFAWLKILKDNKSPDLYDQGLVKISKLLQHMPSNAAIYHNSEITLFLQASSSITGIDNKTATAFLHNIKDHIIDVQQVKSEIYTVKHMRSLVGMARIWIRLLSYQSKINNEILANTTEEFHNRKDAERATLLNSTLILSRELKIIGHEISLGNPPIQFGKFLDFLHTQGPWPQENYGQNLVDFIRITKKMVLGGNEHTLNAIEWERLCDKLHIMVDMAFDITSLRRQAHTDQEVYIAARYMAIKIHNLLYNSSDTGPYIIDGEEFITALSFLWKIVDEKSYTKDINVLNNIHAILNQTYNEVPPQLTNQHNVSTNLNKSIPTDTNYGNAIQTFKQMAHEIKVRLFKDDTDGYTAGHIAHLSKIAENFFSRLIYMDVTYDLYSDIMSSNETITYLPKRTHKEYSRIPPHLIQELEAEFSDIVKNSCFYENENTKIFYGNFCKRSKNGLIKIAALRWLATQLGNLFGHKDEYGRLFVSNEELASIMFVFKPAFEYYGMWIKNPRRFINNTMIFADLFQYNSNGDLKIDAVEAAELGIIAINAFQLGTAISSALNNYCNPKQIDGLTGYNQECVYKHFLHILLEELDQKNNLVNFNTYIETLPSHIQNQFVKSMREIMIPKEIDVLTGKEIIITTGAVLAIESCYIRFDANKDNLLDNDEVTTALEEVFKRTVILMANLSPNKEKYAPTVFNYMLKEASIPHNWAIIWDHYISSPDLQITRLQVAKVTAEMIKTARKNRNARQQKTPPDKQ